MSAEIVKDTPWSHPETPEIPESPWWRVEQGAAYAQLHKQELYRACRKRQLLHVKVGGRRTILVKREWVDAWLESQQTLVMPTRGRAA
jgi:excisionase family DNA binding protein